MKNRLFIIIVLMFFFCGISLASRGPAERGVVPPSSIRSGLVRSPSQIDTRGNLVVTGNVGGGRHFRGVVPYGDTSEFRDTIGSSSLDSFLRYSAGSEYFGRYDGTVQPFYSPSGTVTTTGPGRSVPYSPLTTGIRARAVDERVLPPLPGERLLYGMDTETELPGTGDGIWETVSGYGFRDYQTQDSTFWLSRPMSMTSQELQRVILGQSGRYSSDRGITAAQQEEDDRMEQLWWNLNRLDERAAEGGVGVLQPFELQRPMEQPDEDKQLDVYERMRREIDEYQQLLEQLADAEQTREAAEAKKETSGLPIENRKSQIENGQSMGTLQSPPLDELSDVDLVAQAKAILGSHKTFASFAKDKFNYHIRAAEVYLRQGEYYRAADAYTLASVYKPGDPLAYAGKSHALFAAGEYMSSTLFLSRALEIFPEYARFKIDIVAMIGNMDKLENRIVDIKQWQQVSGSVELQFLLAYIYYQMGRLEPAKEAIDQASEKMPDAPVVLAIKKAIEEAVLNRK